MADVTATFAARDENFNATVAQLQNRLNTFQGGLQGFSNEVANVGATFTRIGIAIGAVIGVFNSVQAALSSFQQTLENADSLNEFANRVKALPGDLALLQTAFQNAGSSAAALEPAINRLNNELGKASQGSAEAQEKFSRLGLNFEILKTQTPIEQLVAVGNAIRQLPTPADQTAAAIAYFGRSGAALVNVLTQLEPELVDARTQLGSYPEILNNSAAAMGRLNDNVVQLQNKVNQFTTGALAALEPLLSNIAESAASIDFSAMGQNLGQALSNAVDFFRGLLANPAQIFGLYGDYLNATFRQAGDSLTSAFLTAVNALGSFLAGLASSGAMSQFSDVMANAFMLAVAKFNQAMFDAVESVLSFYGNLWDAVTSQGVQGLASKLLDVVRFFASDFVQAMTSPAAFVAGQLASALTGATKSASREYQFAFDAATGSYIDKARAGLTAVVTGSGQRLEESATAFGETLVSSAASAANNTKVVEANLFGGAQAIQQVNDRIAAIAQAGASFRTSLEASTQPAEGIKGAISDLPVSGRSLKEVMRDSFPLATAIKDEARAMAQEGQLFASSVSAAKVDAQITSDLFIGLSNRMNNAVNATSNMLDQMREAFYFGRETAQQTYERIRDGGLDVNQAHREAADYTQRQNQADIDLRRLETRERLADNQRDRAYDRAAKLDIMGQEAAASRMRQNADARYTRKLEELRPDLEEAMENVKQLAQEAGDSIKASGDSVSTGGSSADDAMTDGGEDAGESIRSAADALKNVVDNINQQLALEKTLRMCRDFLKSIDEKLPQNALS